MSQGTKTTNRGKRSTAKEAIRKTQMAIDETVIVLVELGSASKSTKQKQRIDKLVINLQKASRELPFQDDSAVGIPKVFKLIKRAIGLWKTMF